MIRYAIVGTGWRSEFYARIAKALPQKYEVVAWLCRNIEKMSYLHETYGVYTTMSENDVVQLKPDFIVCAVDKVSMNTVSRYWAEKGVPVLAETPAGLDVQSLRDLKKSVDDGCKIQIAEQYFLEPDIEVIIKEVESGVIGEPVSVFLSAMHDYHAVSVIRRLLKTGFENVSITGKAFDMPVTNTRTRYETLTDGKIITAEQKHFIMEYEGGKTAFYDFMSQQYRSPIRNKYINVRGTRGEIINDTVFYLNEDNLHEEKQLCASNPYENAGLSNGETAIVRLLDGMKKYVTTGTEVYPLNEAIYDAYVTLLMNKAADNSYTTIKSNIDFI